MSPITENIGKNVITQIVANAQTEFDTPENVLVSWNNQFRIKKEILEEDI